MNRRYQYGSVGKRERGTLGNCQDSSTEFQQRESWGRGGVGAGGENLRIRNKEKELGATM